MAISYDFDIHWIIPQDVLSDPKIAKMMGDIGFKQDARANYVALFRDPRTVEVLRGADPRLAKWLEQSGFGFNVYDSGAGPGRYPAKDEEARLDVINRLSDNLKGAGLKGIVLNGFDFGEFLKAVVQAKPVGAAAAPVPSPAPATARARVPAPAAAGGAPQSSAIDAAFANPKSGARLPVRDGAGPSVQDLLDGPLAYDAPAMAQPVVPMDDLKFRPSVEVSRSPRSGIPMMPLIMVGAVMLLFLLFVVMGGSGGALVAR